MKRFLALTLFLCLILCSCSRTVKMNFSEDGTLTGGNCTYKFAPVGYEPTYQGEEYGEIQGTLSEKLYTIKDCDPREWLATEYTGAATLVYYSADIELPTLAEMKPVNCFICEQDAAAFSICALGVEGDNISGGTVSHDREVIAGLVKMITEGDEDEIWPRSDLSYSYDLKFYSPDWPAIYYNVVYAVCRGGNFLYDRVTGNCVNAGDILLEYYENMSSPENDS